MVLGRRRQRQRQQQQRQAAGQEDARTKELLAKAGDFTDSDSSSLGPIGQLAGGSAGVEGYGTKSLRDFWVHNTGELVIALNCTTW